MNDSETELAPEEESAEVAPVRQGEDLDWLTIERYLRQHLDLPSGMQVLQFPNGSANLTYLLQFDDRKLVFRRPPFGIIAPGAHDMKREFRILEVLEPVFTRVARPVHLCLDDSVAGARFFVMEYVPGVAVRNTIPNEMRHHSEIGRRVSRALAGATAELHAVDASMFEAAGLGRGSGFVDRQLKGWQRRWELVRRDDTSQRMSILHERLVSSKPQSASVSIIHNDLKLDNCLFAPGDPDSVRVLLDWDMATVGDPLVDVGTLVNYWPDKSVAGESSKVLFPVSREWVSSAATS